MKIPSRFLILFDGIRENCILRAGWRTRGEYGKARRNISFPTENT